MWHPLSTTVRHPARARRSVRRTPTPELLEERALLSSGSPASNFAYKVALDSAGNTYAIGQFTGTVDFGPGPTGGHLHLTDQNPSPSSGTTLGTDGFLAKYDPTGNLLWVERTDAQGADNYGVIALAIGQDPTTDRDVIYVITENTGFVSTQTDPASSIRTFDSADGTERWTIPVPATDRSAGQSAFGLPTITADATGAYLFEHMVGSDTGTTYTFDSATPPDPASVVTVTSTDPEQTECVARYDVAGRYQWVTPVRGGFGSRPIAITMGSNTVYVAGDFQGSVILENQTVLTNKGSSFPDTYIVKLHATDGTLVRKVDDHGQSIPDVLGQVDQEFRSMVYDHGAIYVTTLYPLRAEKLDPDTWSVIWTATTEDTDGFSADVQSMTIADGLCYSTGALVHAGDLYDFDPGTIRSDDTLTCSGWADAFVWAVNANDGRFAWVHGYGGASDTYEPFMDVGWGIAAGGTRVVMAGQFYATQVSFGNGLTLENATDVDGYVLSLDSHKGLATWVRQIGVVPGSDTTPPTITTFSPNGTPVSSVDVTFSESIDDSSLTRAAVSLKRDGSSVALSGLSFTLVAGTTYQLNGVADFTSAGGTYVLTVDMTQIKDLAGNSGTGPASTSWVVDKTGPTASFTKVSPNPRNTSVSSVDVVFSKPIDEITLTPAAVSLTRNGAVVALKGLSFSPVAGTTYRLSGLDAFTTAEGTYVLSLDITQVKDLAGNSGTGIATDSWVMALPRPTAKVTAVSPDPRNTAVATVTVVFSEPIETFTTGAVSLTRNGKAVPLRGLSISHVSGNTYRVGGLAGFTAAAGTYVLRVDLTKVESLAHKAGTGTASASWVLDLTRPTAKLTPVSPNPRKTVVSTVNVTFSEAIQTGTFTARAVSLTRNGRPVTVGGLTIRLVSGTTYQIGGLGRFSAIKGTYLLRVNATKVRDLAGNAGVGLASDTWVMTKTVASATGITVFTPF